MIFLFIDFFVPFESIDISGKSGAVIGMINGEVVLCNIVCPIEVARGLIKSKFFL